MGSGINTVGDEASPFIHADNQSFYFTSNGLPGYGEEDIFIVRKTADGKWGAPENLGYPINTIDQLDFSHFPVIFISVLLLNARPSSERLSAMGRVAPKPFEVTRPAVMPLFNR